MRADGTRRKTGNKKRWTMPLFGHQADREMLQTGLAPDIPEDLYMLIKKVRALKNPSRNCLC
jgi:hypothetical protein